MNRLWAHLHLGKYPPLFRRTSFWVWGAILLSFAVCAMVAWLHVQEIATIRRAMVDLDNVRQARVDLAKGFLHVDLALGQGSPFSEADGLARLRQAVVAFENAAARIDDIEPSRLDTFRQSVRAFQQQLELWRGQGAREAARDTVALRVAFNDLERQAELLDRQTQVHLRAHSAHLDHQFKGALAVAVFLLSAVCASVLVMGLTSKYFEKVSREMETRFQLAMEATNEGLWDLNVATGAVYYSPGYWRMLGYSNSERAGVIGSWEELLHPEDRARVLATNQACYEGKSEKFVTEFRLRARDGSWRWILSRGKVIERNAQGGATRLVGTHVDITERREAEEALRASEEQFRAMFQLVNVGIVQADPREGQMIRFNKRYCDITGYSPDELLKIRFPNLTHPEDRQRDWDLFSKAVNGEADGYQNEKRYVRKDGGIVWVRISATFMRDAEGRPFRSVAICEDITQRKRAEEEKEKLQDQLLQAQKLESIGRLAGGVAHDFNNLLGVIIGHADVMRDQMGDNHPLAEDLSEIQAASVRAADLTRQLLAFARKQAVSPRVLDLNETVDHMLKMLKRLIGEDIDLAWAPGKDLWPVKVDSMQVDQILANLCVNARDAIAGVGKVTIETRNVAVDAAFAESHGGAAPGDYVALAVSDNGCGMDRPTMGLIFEPFFTTKEPGRGTGLGLSMVYGVAKQNGGFVEVSSEVGKGSTFRVYFPRQAGEQAPVRSAALPPRPEAAKGQGQVILVVEDDDSLLKLTRIMLEREGYVVLSANKPEEVFRLAESRSSEIRLLMTDVIMPDMNGCEIWEQIRGRCPSAQCLYMSGYTADAIAHHGVLDAAVHFIQKPFTRKMLSEKVRQLLAEGGGPASAPEGKTRAEV